MNPNDLQRIFLTGFAIGLLTGLVITSFLGLALTLRARHRYRYALRHIESLSVALRGCAAPRSSPLPPLKLLAPSEEPPEAFLRQRPPSLAGRPDWATETQRMPVITSASVGTVAGW